LQSVAVCCSALQCVAVCCSVSPCVALCCSVLQCVAVCCSVLQCVAVCCSVLHCVAVCWLRVEVQRLHLVYILCNTHCNTLQLTTTLQLTATTGKEKHRNTLQHTATHCNTLQHTATHCNILCAPVLQSLHPQLMTRCNTLQHDATYCITCCSMLQCVAVCCSVVVHTCIATSSRSSVNNSCINSRSMSSS